jgi:2-keto-3-deoxy-L-rhamnonate aldolase RhmA
VVADQEHAPIDLGALDLVAMAGRSVGLPVLIRAACDDPPAIWPALDLGAVGAMVPHVRSGPQAEGIVDAIKYGRGKRGFSPSGRAGNYGTIPAADYRAQSDERSVIFAQVEDAEALDRLEAIAAVPDIDVLFVGPADLSLSLGCAIDAPELDAAIHRVIAAARDAGKASGLFVVAADQVARWAARGITVFVCSSDQGLLLNAARGLIKTARPNT